MFGKSWRPAVWCNSLLQQVWVILFSDILQGSKPEKAIIKRSLVSTVTNCFTEQNRNCKSSLNFLNVKQRSYCPTECAQSFSSGREMGQKLCLSRSVGKKKSACFLTLASRILDSNASAEGRYYRICLRVFLESPHCNNTECNLSHFTALYVQMQLC